jgi:energy-coupling factor transport system substrate-specific component
MQGRRGTALNIREMAIFAMLGTIMFCSKIIMEVLPNIHLLGMFTMTYTVVFRKKALLPIYIYVFLNGLYAGFDVWWLPYLYIWTILWGITMLLPKRMPIKLKIVVYPILCGIHGFAFGALYAPAQAVMFGFTLEQTLAWIIAGLPWDIIHGIGNLFAGMLIVPLSELIARLAKKQHIS